MENGEAACAKIKETVPDANISTMVLDLNALASIDSFVKTFLEKFDRLDVLINNAGIMACPKALTVDGIESQFGVCHVGHFHLASLPLPTLIKSGSKETPSYAYFLSLTYPAVSLTCPLLLTTSKVHVLMDFSGMISSKQSITMPEKDTVKRHN
jgi:NAD(P)-dependent dehydrogenase (short-subunit alcohol dehydrogenase family)